MYGPETGTQLSETSIEPLRRHLQSKVSADDSDRHRKFIPSSGITDEQLLRWIENQSEAPQVVKNSFGGGGDGGGGA